MIPEDVWTNFECIIFHMTDLPFGQQNLLVPGIYKTKISAIRIGAARNSGSRRASDDEILTAGALTEEQLRKKIDAMRCYRSELRAFPHPRSSEYLEALARVRGGQSGTPAAEAFALLYRRV
jgi:hypothetical protein